MSAGADRAPPGRGHRRLLGSLGIRGRLLLVSAALLLVAGLVGFFYLRGALDRGLERSVKDELEVRLALVEREVSERSFALEPSKEWDDLADDLGARGNARVTIFDTHERILGDSHLALAEVLEGRSDDRPEFRAALGGTRGESTRWSAVLKEEVTYVATGITRDGRVVAVVRVAMPHSQLAATARALERELLLVVAAGVALAFAFIAVAGHLALRGVRDLTTTARKMAEGDLTVKTGAEGADEIADLGRSLEQLADSLRESMKELVGERDLLSGVLSTMREGVLILDREGVVVLMNPALREMLLLGDDVAGKRPEAVIDDPRLVDLIDTARARAEGQQGEIEAKGIRPRRLLAHAEPLEVEPRGLLVVFHDVTDLRRLETLRRDFVANASHELRTPVTSIRSAAETLSLVPAGDRDTQKRFLDVIERNAERLQRLVEDLLDLSKIESRELDLKTAPLELRAIAERVVRLLAERAAKVGTELRVEIPADLPPAIADARALEQVLENLLDNAIKYCPGAVVRVTAEPEDGGVALAVEDTGPGIAERHLARIFERFYRVDAGRSRQLGGTGLGLAIVKHLVEAMGGEVRVTSKVGSGTRFVVALPGRPGPPTDPPS